MISAAELTKLVRPACRPFQASSEHQDKNLAHSGPRLRKSSRSTAGDVRGKASRRQTESARQKGFKGRDEKRGNQFYINITGFPFPLGPLFNRPTVRTEVHAAMSSAEKDLLCGHIVSSSISLERRLRGAGYGSLSSSRHWPSAT